MDTYTNLSEQPLYRKPYAFLFAKWLIQQEKKITRKINGVIITSDQLKSYYKALINENKIHTIYNYTNLIAPAQTIEFSSKEYDFIYTGTVTRIRGAIEMIQAISHLKKTLPSVKLLIIGTIYDQNLHKEIDGLINQYNLTQNVFLEKEVSFQEIVKYYLNSKVGLGLYLPVPSNFKILQLKIFEYMAFGLPIICNNFGDIDRITKENQSGICVNPLNSFEIAEAMLKLISNEEFYKAISRNALVAYNKYCWQNVEPLFQKIFEHID
jgi:glycosyltransferase involved in cell wall biosynthesis